MKRLNFVLDKADRAVGTLSDAAVAVSSIILVLLVFMVSAYVFQREFLGGGWGFVEEWSGYLLVLMVYWCCADTLRSGGHITVEMLVRFLGKRTRQWLSVFNSLLALAILIFFTDASIRWVIYAVEESTHSFYVSGTPLWIPYAFVPTGLVVFSLAMAQHMVSNVVAAVKGIGKEEATTYLED